MQYKLSPDLLRVDIDISNGSVIELLAKSLLENAKAYNRSPLFMDSTFFAMPVSVTLYHPGVDPVGSLSLVVRT